MISVSSANNENSQETIADTETTENIVYDTETAAETDNKIGSFVNKNAQAQKEIVFQGKTVLLNYKRTYNNSKVLPENRSDVYGTCDIYADSDGSEYEFLYNTDLLCAYFDLGNHIPISQDVISEAKAKDIAIEFITGLIGNKLSEYTFEESFLSQSTCYVFYFYKYMNNIKTDDRIGIYVRTDGTIYAFASYKYSRYDSYADQIKQCDIDNVINNIEKRISDDNIVDYKVDKKFITKNDDGQVVLSYWVKGSIYNEPLFD